MTATRIATALGILSAISFLTHRYVWARLVRDELPRLPHRLVDRGKLHRRRVRHVLRHVRQVDHVAGADKGLQLLDEEGSKPVVRVAARHAGISSERKAATIAAASHGRAPCTRISSASLSR